MSDPAPPSLPPTLPEPPPSIPSMGRRVVLGTVWFVVLAVVMVGVPLEAIQVASAHQVASSLSTDTIFAAGIALAALGALRYVLRPTSAFGPLSMLSSAVGVAYLWLLGGTAHVTVVIGGTGSISLGFGELMHLLSIVPAIGFVAALVTTVEDAVRPGERVRVDYPPRSPSPY